MKWTVKPKNCKWASTESSTLVFPSWSKPVQDEDKEDDDDGGGLQLTVVHLGTRTAALNSLRGRVCQKAKKEEEEEGKIVPFNAADTSAPLTDKCDQVEGFGWLVSSAFCILLLRNHAFFPQSDLTMPSSCCIIMPLNRFWHYAHTFFTFLCNVQDLFFSLLFLQMSRCALFFEVITATAASGRSVTQLFNQFYLLL